MDQIFEKSRRRITSVPVRFVRGLMNEINWDARLIGIKGARGTGKTTLLLQYIRLHLENKLDSVLYASLDNIWFSENKLLDLVDYFMKQGGKYLFLDEVHKYPGWSVELKNIYDDYPELKVVFTGSSLLEILNARADLSRRAVVYQMQGLSYREYLNLKLETDFPVLSMNDILNNHPEESGKILTRIKPLRHLSDYLINGYYPFFTEQLDLYFSRLEEIINMIIEIELPLLRNVDASYIIKLKQLLLVISESAPFIPNTSKLAERLCINRHTLINYLNYLDEVYLITTVYKDASGLTRLQKPDKIFLENTNLMHALAQDSVNKDSSREAFFLNQLKYKHLVEISEFTDFLIDKKYSFEIGGSNKKKKQLKKSRNSYIAADNIEFGFGTTIPLWLFGFLY